MAENYNIKINIEDLPGARIMDIAVGEGRVVTCACIPVDNFRGFCANAYITPTNEVRSLKKATLNFCAYGLDESRYGDTHCVRPALNRDAAQKMPEDAVKRHERIVGYMRPFSSKGGGSRGAQPAGDDDYWK